MPQLWRFKELPYALAYFRWLPWPPTSGNGRWHHGRSEQREGEITWQNRNPDHGRGWVHCTIALSSELTGGLTITTPISSRAATQHLTFPHFSSTLLGALLPSHGHTEDRSMDTWAFGGQTQAFTWYKVQVLTVFGDWFGAPSEFPAHTHLWKTMLY